MNSTDYDEPVQDLPETVTPEQEEHLLHYHQQLDHVADREDKVNPQDHSWTIEKMLRHDRLPQGRLMVKVCWKNGGQSWQSMNAVRLSDPYALLLYAIGNNLTNNEGWEWTTPYINDMDLTMQVVQAYQASRKTPPKHQFGEEVPRSIKHALEIDKCNGNNKWRESINKELQQLRDYDTFHQLDSCNDIPEGYSRTPYHFVFAIKVDGRCKSRLVAGGNRAPDYGGAVYSGVVGTDAVRLAFLHASLNNLTVCAADVGNAFLYAKCKEKLYVVAGDDFGPAWKGKPLLLNKGLYGVYSAAAGFHEHLAARLRSLGYKPSKTDFDLWMKDEGDHYSMIATCVDDLLISHRDPMSIIKELKKDYILKGVGAPECYLGGNIIDSTGTPWEKEGVPYGISAHTYITNVVDKLQRLTNSTFKTHRTPMDNNYHPELDDTDLLDDQQASIYRTIMGSAQWAVTLGRFDVQHATSTLSRHNQAPRQGHLIAAKRMFGYLYKFRQGQMLIDPNPDYMPRDDYPLEYDPEWRTFYPDAEFEPPPDPPPAKGKGAKITIYVDADHARDKVTRRSVTGIIVIVNGTVVKSISKRQTTVETSSYGSEMVAARIAVDEAISILCNLTMLGIPIDGQPLILGDNKSVILNTTMPTSTLKKKHQACNYHRVREAIAAQLVYFQHCDSRNNASDCLTKPLANEGHHRCTRPFLFRTPGATFKTNRETQHDLEKSPITPIPTTTHHLAQPALHTITPATETRILHCVAGCALN